MAEILIVDDSKFMRKMLSDILTEDGHRVVGEAENAREATELSKLLTPDLVTMDIVMPEVDGLNTITALKKMIASSPETKVVMVSAMGQQEVIVECIDAGASGFIVKPFQPSDVTGVIENVIRRV